jgi:hypothetical protein
MARHRPAKDRSVEQRLISYQDLSDWDYRQMSTGEAGNDIRREQKRKPGKDLKQETLDSFVTTGIKRAEKEGVLKKGDRKSGRYHFIRDHLTELGGGKTNREALKDALTKSSEPDPMKAAELRLSRQKVVNYGTKKKWRGNKVSDEIVPLGYVNFQAIADKLQKDNFEYVGRNRKAKVSMIRIYQPVTTEENESLKEAIESLNVKKLSPDEKAKVTAYIQKFLNNIVIDDQGINRKAYLAIRKKFIEAGGKPGAIARAETVESPLVPLAIDITASPRQKQTAQWWLNLMKGDLTDMEKINIDQYNALKAKKDSGIILDRREIVRLNKLTKIKEQTDKRREDFNLKMMNSKSLLGALTNMVLGKKATQTQYKGMDAAGKTYYKQALKNIKVASKNLAVDDELEIKNKTVRELAGRMVTSAKFHNDSAASSINRIRSFNSDILRIQEAAGLTPEKKASEIDKINKKIREEYSHYKSSIKSMTDLQTAARKFTRLLKATGLDDESYRKNIIQANTFLGLDPSTARQQKWNISPVINTYFDVKKIDNIKREDTIMLDTDFFVDIASKNKKDFVEILERENIGKLPKREINRRAGLMSELVKNYNILSGKAVFNKDALYERKRSELGKAIDSFKQLTASLSDKDPRKSLYEASIAEREEELKLLDTRMFPKIDFDVITEPKNINLMLRARKKGEAGWLSQKGFLSKTQAYEMGRRLKDRGFETKLFSIPDRATFMFDEVDEAIKGQTGKLQKERKKALPGPGER